MDFVPAIKDRERGAEDVAIARDLIDRTIGVLGAMEQIVS
jgi:hypothetical protein